MYCLLVLKHLDSVYMRWPLAHLALCRLSSIQSAPAGHTHRARCQPYLIEWVGGIGRFDSITYANPASGWPRTMLREWGGHTIVHLVHVHMDHVHVPAILKIAAGGDQRGTAPWHARRFGPPDHSEVRCALTW